MEWAADEHGAVLAFESSLSRPDTTFVSGDTALAKAGIDIFFTYQIFLRDVLNWPDSAYHSTSTPEVRRDKLRKIFWREMPEKAQDLATKAEGLFKAFTEILEPNEEGR